MILEKFKNLSVSTQTTIISQFGYPVAELIDDYFIYLLYQYSDFYVEIRCLRTNYNFNSLHAFSAKSCYLDIYLNEIDISPCTD